MVLGLLRPISVFFSNENGQSVPVFNWCSLGKDNSNGNTMAVIDSGLLGKKVL